MIFELMEIKLGKYGFPSNVNTQNRRYKENRRRSNLCVTYYQFKIIFPVSCYQVNQPNIFKKSCSTYKELIVLYSTTAEWTQVLFFLNILLGHYSCCCVTDLRHTPLNTQKLCPTQLLAWELCVQSSGTHDLANYETMEIVIVSSRVGMI